MEHVELVARNPAYHLVFVFDDDPNVGLLTSKMLGALGLHAQHFQTAPAFLTGVRTLAPQVVLLDLALGRTDAVEVLRQLSVIKYTGAVLLISGKDLDLLDAVHKIGAAQGLAMLPPLQKPFRLPELKQALTSAPLQVQCAVAPTNMARVGLKEALEHNWLELWYQPKISLKTNILCGAEALVRVRHPRFGVIAPSEFLPHSGDPLHAPLFQFVLGQSVGHWFKLANVGVRLPLSINAPASLLLSGELTSLIRQTLPQQDGFPGLIIEITEEEIIREPVAARELATQLRLYNVLLSVDDFGAGAASLSRVRDLPLHELKLDRSFVFGCANDKRNRLVCESTAKIAHQYSVSVCAEGVENSADLAVVRSLGFDAAQGYLFAKPLPLPDFIKRIQDRATKQPIQPATEAWAA